MKQKTLEQQLADQLEKRDDIDTEIKIIKLKMKKRDKRKNPNDSKTNALRVGEVSQDL
jgi:hypothetical protein